MTDRLITADARKVSGRDFFEAVFGSTPERRKQLVEEGRKIAAALDAKNRADILTMRDRMAAMVSDETAAKWREEWALQDRIRGELDFTMELQAGRRAA